MPVTIISPYLYIVNRNAIVFLTLHQKYYGENFCISTADTAGLSVMFSSRSAGQARSQTVRRFFL